MSLESQLIALAQRIGQLLKQRAVPAGGSAGQTLQKRTALDWDMGWETPAPAQAGPTLTLTASGGAVSLGTVVVDSFTGPLNRDWEALSGTPTITDGRFTGSEAIARWRPADIQSAGDHAIQSRAWGSAYNVYVRYQNNSNRVALGLYQGQLTLAKLIGGTSTILRQWPVTPDSVAGNVIRLESIGNTLRAYWDGTLMGTVTEAALAGVPYVALYTSSGSSHDDVRVDMAGGQITGLPDGSVVRARGLVVPASAVPAGEFTVYLNGARLVSGWMNAGDTLAFVNQGTVGVLTAADVGALPITGGTATGQIRVEGTAPGTPAFEAKGASAGWLSGLKLNNTTAGTGRAFGIYASEGGTFAVTDETGGGAAILELDGATGNLSVSRGQIREGTSRVATLGPDGLVKPEQLPASTGSGAQTAVLSAPWTFVGNNSGSVSAKLPLSVTVAQGKRVGFRFVLKWTHNSGSTDFIRLQFATPGGGAELFAKISIQSGTTFGTDLFHEAVVMSATLGVTPATGTFGASAEGMAIVEGHIYAATGAATLQLTAALKTSATATLTVHAGSHLIARPLN